ncbi:hypothetical protein [Marinomonas fungiae]|uniref:ATP-binding protein n=1 Tax=Marinomonas fungiae TaxID=1137284 RepID=UPI003A8D6335
MQRSFSYTLEVEIPSSLDNERIEQWLWESGFGAIKHVARPTQLSTSESAALRYLTYWQYFFQSMLLEIGVPLFTVPQISVQKGKRDNAYVLTISIPELAGHYALYKAALEPSFQLMTAFATTELSKDAFEVIASQAAASLYNPLKAASLSGVSTVPIMRRAWQCGIPIQHLGMGIFQLGYGAKRRLLRKSSTEQDSSMGLLLSESKLNSASLFRSLGLPGAQHRLIQSLSQAKLAAQQIGYPLVVKPENGNRSEGITLDVANEEELAEAVSFAQSVSPQVLVEKQVLGPNYRLFVCQNELLYVHCNLPRCVIGDGKLSVKELLEQDAEQQLKSLPWRRYPAIPLDRETLICLEQQAVSISDRPHVGQKVFVRKVSSTEWGAAEREGTPLDQVHPENRDLAIRAAQAVSLATAGVDLIIPDIGQPWYEQTCLITEINYSPMMGVSEASRAAVPRFVELLFNGGDGRIPVHVYIGDDQAFLAAEKMQSQLLAQGVKAFVCSHARTLNNRQEDFYLPFTTLLERSKALLRNVDVEALLVVVQTDEVLQQGAAIDQVDSVQPVGAALSVQQATQGNVFNSVLSLYQSLVKGAKGA